MSKTFQNLSQKEIEEYKKGLQKRDEKRKEAIKERYNEAWKLAKQIADILYNKYMAKEVILFGSLVDFSHFKEWSDIDVAIRGIPNELYFKAIAEVLSLCENFDIDIVDLDDCTEGLKEVILEKGVKI